MTDPKLRELLDEYAETCGAVRINAARLALEHYVASVRREALEERAMEEPK